VNVPSAGPAPPTTSLAELFLISLRLGCTSFGGPIAHLGYFREEYVLKRNWLDESAFADLVALGQVLPGPASSQVSIGIGTMRRGWRGGLLAWLGFTLPSAILMTIFALVITGRDIGNAGWLHGLKIVAVAVVAQAVWGMARKFCTDRTRILMAIGAGAVLIAWQTAIAQIAVIALGAVIGWLLLTRQGTSNPGIHHRSPHGRRFGGICLGLFAIILIGLPLLTGSDRSSPLGMVRVFYEAGSLVFGGGHVVLPILQRQVVPTGWMTDSTFLGGYGAAQAMPGPLFSFAAFLGAARSPTPNGILGAAIATVAIFAPSILLIWGGLPFWDQLRTSLSFRGALAGINAVVVGLLAAALYTPVWTSAINAVSDVMLALICLLLVLSRRLPTIAIVVFAAGGGEIITRLL